MAESMRGLKRSHRCAELSEKNIGEKVTVMGWVAKQRNKGGIIFVDLRDRSGILQIIFEEESVGAEGFEKAYHLRSEFVIAVEGTVAKRMVEFGSKKEIFENPLHPYTKALFSAIPNPNPDVKMNRMVLKGDIPSPANPPKGCRFHTRCPYATEKCRHITPEYKDYGNGHFAACHLLDDGE